MRGLKRLRSARVISADHAFVQNLRRGYYELATRVDPRRRLLDGLHRNHSRHLIRWHQPRSSLTALSQRNIPTTLPGIVGNQTSHPPTRHHPIPPAKILRFTTLSTVRPVHVRVSGGYNERRYILPCAHSSGLYG
jgi:hypothetical protein